MFLARTTEATCWPTNNSCEAVVVGEESKSILLESRDLFMSVRLIVAFSRMSVVLDRNAAEQVIRRIGSSKYAIKFCPYNRKFTDLDRKNPFDR